MVHIYINYIQYNIRNIIYDDGMIYYKVGYVFVMIISSELRIGQYGLYYEDDDHRKDTPHFI